MRNLLTYGHRLCLRRDPLATEGVNVVITAHVEVENAVAKLTAKSTTLGKILGVVSDRAHSITGAEILIDGGKSPCI